jgi:lipopolysaccharide export system permease protein
MMLFQRRLLVELLANAASTLLILSVVLMLASIAQVLAHPEGLSLPSLARILPIFAFSQLDITLPISVLVSVVLTYGRAAADNEIDALRTSGVHPLQVGLPGLLFGTLMSLTLLAAMDYAKPWAEVVKDRFRNDIDLGAVLRNKLSAGEPVNLNDGRTVITVDGFNEQGQALGVRLQQYSEDGEIERELLAERAEIGVQPARGELTLTLRNFHTVRGPRFDGVETTVTVQVGRGSTELDIDDLTTPQLLSELQRGDRLSGIKRGEVELTIYMRVAGAAACLLFTLVGMPLALLFRRGDRTGAFLIAFLVALFLYFPSREVSVYLADKKLLSPGVASCTGCALLLVVGVGLCRRVLLR